MKRKARYLVHLILCIILLTFSLPGIVTAAPERRTALVIGNGAYESGKLNNPMNDATDMASALRKVGFDVIHKQNIRQREMEDALEEFGKRLKRGGVGLFYFAGHGVQMGGVNYLIPIGAKIRKDSDVRHEALSAERVLDEMADANNGLNIVLLDACRDNPFTRSFRTITRGLAVLDRAPEGTFISYATGPGQVARDGDGRNSPYTAALLRQMIVPGLPIEQVFKNVRLQLSAMKQTPWELSSLKGDFSFVPGAAKWSGEVPAVIPALQESTNLQSEKPADDLDLVLAQVQQEKEAQERRKREAREAEERLKEEQSRQFRNLLDDLKKYEAVQSSDIDSEKKAAAWRALTRKYPAWSASVPADRPEDLLAKALTEDKYGSWLQMAMGAGIRVRFISLTLGASFVLIHPGTFQMGSPQDEVDRNNDEIRHPVTLTKPFFLQTTEVTQGQWKKVMGDNPSRFRQCGDDCPVESVSWNDVQEFIRKLNSMEGTDKYRLPTEAQWEYAARSGGKSEKWSGTGNESDLGGHAWYEANSGGRTRPVGNKKPNALGLYDMSGNVWEWVQDWYGEYNTGSVTDPEGPLAGSSRVNRGGSWNYFARSCRSAYRYSLGPGVPSSFLGFRLARTP